MNYNTTRVNTVLILIITVLSVLAIFVFATSQAWAAPPLQQGYVNHSIPLNSNCSSHKVQVKVQYSGQGSLTMAFLDANGTVVGQEQNFACNPTCWVSHEDTAATSAVQHLIRGFGPNPVIVEHWESECASEPQPQPQPQPQPSVPERDSRLFTCNGVPGQSYKYPIDDKYFWPSIFIPEYFPNIDRTMTALFAPGRVGTHKILIDPTRGDLRIACFYSESQGDIKDWRLMEWTHFIPEITNDNGFSAISLYTGHSGVKYKFVFSSGNILSAEGYYNFYCE